MNSSESDELRSRYKTAIAIEIAVFLVVIILTAVGWFRPPMLAAGNLDLTAVWILILFIAAGSFVLRRFLTSWSRIRDIKLLRGNSGVSKALMNNSLLLSLIPLIIAIAGFCAALFSGDKFDMLRGTAVAIVLLAVNFPRRRLWSRIMEMLDEV